MLEYVNTKRGTRIMAAILIIEDEAKIARFVQLELSHEGYEVDTAADGRTGLEKALSGRFDLIVLDLMLPALSGIEVCRRIRSAGNELPIIMLTAKDDVSDKVMGLDMGADDYMTKPFAIEELLARIRVGLKRREKAQPDVVDERLHVGKLTVDKKAYDVHFEDQGISLTKKEFDLLVYLMEREGEVVTRDSLLNDVWGYEYAGDTNVVDVYIRYLRTKIDEKVKVKYLYTVRGVGYMIKA